MGKKYRSYQKAIPPSSRDKADIKSVNHDLNITSVFVGRERELAQLSDALQDALGGSGCMAVLVGEAGIGKTRTAREFMARCSRQEVHVLWGICYAGEETPPFGPWISVLQRYIRASEP